MAGTSVSALAAAVATDIRAFALCEIALYAFIGATVSGGVVILAEELPIELRARGQSWGGLGMGLGGGLCLTLMPMVTSHHSWRWMLVLASVMGVVALWRAGSGHHGKRPMATRRRERHDFGQQLLRRVRKTLSTPRDHGPVLLVARQYRGCRGQQLGVLPPGLGRRIEAGRRQRPDAGRRRRRDARLPARRARMRALRPHPDNLRRGRDDQSRRARFLLGSSGALASSLAMDRGHVLLFHRRPERRPGGRQFAGNRTFSNRYPRRDDGMVLADRRSRLNHRPDLDRRSRRRASAACRSWSAT